MSWFLTSTAPRPAYRMCGPFKALTRQLPLNPGISIRCAPSAHVYTAFALAAGQDQPVLLAGRRMKVHPKPPSPPQKKIIIIVIMTIMISLIIIMTETVGGWMKRKVEEEEEEEEEEMERKKGEEEYEGPS